MISDEKSNRQILLIAILVLVGFSAGWKGSKYFEGKSVGEPSNKVFEKDVVQAVIESQGISKPVSHQKDTSSVIASKDKKEKLLELILSDSNDPQLTASRVIKYLTLKYEGGDHSILADKALRKRLRESPELNFALIDQYSGIEHLAIKGNVATHLMINNSSLRPFLEPKLMEKIKNGEDSSEMLALLGDWGLQAKSSINYLAEELPYMRKPKDAGAAIRAISQSSWVINSRLTPEEMLPLSDMVNGYRQSEEAEIRAAGVAALAAFPTDNYNELIVKSFDDPSKLVRIEASDLYFRNPFQSNELENTFITRLQDRELGYVERSRIASGLSRLSISTEHMRIVESVKKDLENYIKSLSEEERLALYFN